MASESAPSWPDLKADHPLIALHKRLPDILSASEGYDEIWGVTLVPPKASATAASANPAPTEAPKPSEESPDAIREEPATEPADSAATTEAQVEKPDFKTALILQKFLRANSNNVDKAYDQLRDTMVWRKSFFSPGGESEKGWNEPLFDGLGYVSYIKKDGQDVVVSWNIYGAVKDIKATFGDLDQFIRWRVALMEKSLRLLGIADATEPIPDFGAGEDLYQSVQVHDYKNISFILIPSEVRAASKKTIEMFGRYYPETLSRKYFINVPVVMGWVYTLLKKVVARETIQKLEMISNGGELAKYISDDVPEIYGGKGGSLEAIAVGVDNPKVEEPVTSDGNVDTKPEPEAAEERAEAPVESKTNGTEERQELETDASKTKEPAAEQAKAEEPTPQTNPEPGPVKTEPTPATEPKPTTDPIPAPAAETQKDAEPVSELAKEAQKPEEVSDKPIQTAPDTLPVAPTAPEPEKKE